MKKTKLTGVVAIAMVLSIAFSGVALACCPVPETQCTSNIETTTAVKCNGTVTEDASLNYESSSVSLIPLPPLIVGERYGNTRYSENMISRDGYIDFVKVFDFDNADSAGRPDYNLEVTNTFDYAANTGGGLVFSESVAMDAISAIQPAAPVICPFAAPAGVIQESCEYVEAGSELDVTAVSATTHARTISTARSNDITPVVLHYDVNAGATVLAPLAGGAVGSVSAHMTVHDMEGRAGPGTLGAEVTFTEETTASGIFELYKSMEYESGVLRP